MNLFNNLQQVPLDGSGLTGAFDMMSDAHEFSLAAKSAATAMKLSDLSDREETSKQVQNNRIVSTLIDNQLSFYRNDYDRIQNLVPNTYRG